MNRVQKQKHLAQANRYIAELAVQIRRQREIVKHALDTGQRSEMAESLLDALEGSLLLFEKHRIFLLSCSADRPSKKDIQALRSSMPTCPKTALGPSNGFGEQMFGGK